MDKAEKEKLTSENSALTCDLSLWFFAVIQLTQYPNEISHLLSTLVMRHAHRICTTIS